MALKQLPSNGGFLRGRDLEGNAAILFEVVSDAYETTGGKYKKSAIRVNAYVFKSSADIAKGEPSETHVGAQIEGNRIVRDLDEKIGKGNETIALVRLEENPSGEHPIPSLRQVADSDLKGVEAWWNAQQEAVEADVPDFD